MLGRMEVTAQRIEAREASSRVEQTATYALARVTPSVMEHEDGQCVVHVTCERVLCLSVVSCPTPCAVSHAPSEPAIKVHARDVIAEARAGQLPTPTQRGERKLETSSDDRVPGLCTVSPLPVTSIPACCIDAPTMTVSVR